MRTKIKLTAYVRGERNDQSLWTKHAFGKLVILEVRVGSFTINEDLINNEDLFRKTKQTLDDLRAQ